MLAIALSGGEVELKTVALAPHLQSQGVGRELLAAVLGHLEQLGTHRVVVGTSTSNTGALAFNQRAGFRMWKIERDFFSPAQGYPVGHEEDGIPVRDMLWLDRKLRDPGRIDKLLTPVALARGLSQNSNFLKLWAGQTGGWPRLQARARVEMSQVLVLTEPQLVSVGARQRFELENPPVGLHPHDA